MAKKKDEATIHSSVAEYLTYVAAVGDTDESMEMRYEDENIWLTQKMMAQLYDVSLPTINEHIKKIYGDSELAKSATIRKFRIVQTEGSRQVSREIVHYNLQMVIAVGFKVNNDRAVRFRKWSGQIVKGYTIQGWTMDKDRLKKGHMFTDEYFERQLQNIREIRLSERKFYQKVTDLYATAFDYDKDAKTTKCFFQTVQNKMHWAVHRHTAAELIVERANVGKEHMGLTTWEAAPNGKIIKADVSIAKNYLSDEEMSYMERIVSLYLDYAELQAERQIPMSMEDWAKRLDGFLEFNGMEIKAMEKKVEIAINEYVEVLEKIKERIMQAQYQVMTNANVERNILFWNIGNVILQYSQWGNKFVETLSKDLRMTYPSREGYSVRNLNYMKQFARRIPSEDILHQGGAKLMEFILVGKGLHERY